MFGIEKSMYSGKIAGKGEIVELTDSANKEGEDDEAMWDFVVMAMDLLNIILGLNHGDFAENFIPFQKTNLSSTCAIWMLLILVF